MHDRIIFNISGDSVAIKADGEGVKLNVNASICNTVADGFRTESDVALTPHLARALMLALANAIGDAIEITPRRPDVPLVRPIPIRAGVPAKIVPFRPASRTDDVSQEA